MTTVIDFLKESSQKISDKLFHTSRLQYINSFSKNTIFLNSTAVSTSRGIENIGTIVTKLHHAKHSIPGLFQLITPRVIHTSYRNQ